MRSRRQDPTHQETVSRRLALLSAELAAVRAADPARAEPLPKLDTPANESVAVADARLAQVDESLRVDSMFAAALRPWDVPEHEVRQPEAVTPDSLPGYPGRHAARRKRSVSLTPLPEPLRRRWALGPGQVAILAVIIAVGLAVTAWWAIVQRPHFSDVPPAVAMTVAASPLLSGPPQSQAAGVPAGEPAQQGSDSAQLIVDVAGKVRQPGIAVLKPGSRVVDALKAAGGARRGVDLGSLNLARPLVDGEQILVGVPQPAGVGAAAAASPSPGAPTTLVNLNTATQPELETLPGIGPVTAQAIMSWRTQHDGFGAVEELLDVQGIGEATLAQLAPHVTI